MREAKEILSEIKRAEEHLESLREELTSLTSLTSTGKNIPAFTQVTDAASSTLPATQRINIELPQHADTRPSIGTTKNYCWPLLPSDYERYSRQLILPEIGLLGQRQLACSSVLIIGLGGLGCPAAKYLAGAGVGRIGLVDGDAVETSNLHRQVLHTTARVGVNKVRSAARSLAETNDTVQVSTYEHHLTSGNAVELFDEFDLVLDCTDHPTSRYLISDAAVLAGKPLVSASALRTDGQLIVLNHPPRRQSTITHSGSGQGEVGKTPTSDTVTSTPPSIASIAATPYGPCYRCIFPTPPPAHTLVSCGEGGILGPVVGVMGVLQALEALKILTSSSPSPPTTSPLSSPNSGQQHGSQQQPSSSSPPVTPSMLIFSAYSTPPFRSLRMRPPRPKCIACGNAPTITRESLASGSLDYVAFCGVVEPVKLLDKEERWTAEDLQRRLVGDGGFTVSGDSNGSDKSKDEADETSESAGKSRGSESHIDISRPHIVDVRERTHFELGSLPGSVNVPFSIFSSASDEELRTRLDQAIGANGQVGKAHGEDTITNVEPLILPPPNSAPILFVCRLGNDSQLAAKRVLEMDSYNSNGEVRPGRRWIGDLEGGLRSWKTTVEAGFPDF